MEDIDNTLLENCWAYWPYLWPEEPPVKNDIASGQLKIQDLLTDDPEDVGEALIATFTGVETWLEPSCPCSHRPMVWFGPDIFNSTGPEIFAKVKQNIQQFHWIGCLELEIVGYDEGERVWSHITFLLESAQFDFAIAKRQILEKAKQHKGLSCKVMIRTRQDLNGIFYP
jgi:hypothetical protein